MIISECSVRMNFAAMEMVFTFVLVSEKKYKNY